MVRGRSSALQRLCRPSRRATACTSREPLSQLLAHFGVVLGPSGDAWYSRYKKDGTTTVIGKPRSDKGRTRKMTPEELLEAIEQVRGCFRGRHNIAGIYRLCIEKGLLQRERVAPNTFRRIVKAHELLKSDVETETKRRLAFAKAHANELWQADRMFGPYVSHGAGKVQSKLIAFIDDASRVCCHGEFFLAENTEMLLKGFKSALYKRGLREALYVDFVPRNKIDVLCPVAMCGRADPSRGKGARKRRKLPHNLSRIAQTRLQSRTPREGGANARAILHSSGNRGSYPKLMARRCHREVRQVAVEASVQGSVRPLQGWVTRFSPPSTKPIRPSCARLATATS